jgi:hypothetical protein
MSHLSLLEAFITNNVCPLIPSGTISSYVAFRYVVNTIYENVANMTAIQVNYDTVKALTNEVFTFCKGSL